MRRSPTAVIVVVGALLAGGCGSAQRRAAEPGQQPGGTLELQLDGGSAQASEPPPASTDAAPAAPEAAPEAGAVLEILIQAAARQEPSLLWETLSTQTRERLGPTEQEFAQGAAVQLADTLGSLAGDGADYAVVLAIRTAPGWAVAAVVGQRMVAGRTQLAAFAAAFREQDGVYRAELGGPVELTPVVPASVPVGSRPPVGVQIAAPVAVEDAAVWLDGVAVQARAAGPDDRNLLVAGPPAQPFGAGAHAGIGYARAGDEATAIAWIFETS